MATHHDRAKSGTPLKLHLDKASGEYRITGYRPGAVVVNDEVHAGALLITVQAAPRPWSVAGFEDLDESAVAALLDPAPEVLLIGTGARQRFPEPAALAALYAANIGFEVMDTRAACRTFNILAAEGRQVTAAIWPLDE